MPRFAANLSLLFPDLPLLDRVAAAAAAGFSAVECQFPYAEPAAAWAERLQRHGVQMVLHNLPAGDWAAGERGLASHPGREAEFDRGLEQALAYALALGVPRLNVLAGVLPPGVSAQQATDTLCANLSRAAARLAPHGLQLLLEPINTHDVPGFVVNGTEQALALIDRVGAPNLALQLDLYHAHRMGEPVDALLRQHAHRLGHVQLADAPGRHEPGTGTAPLADWLALLDAPVCTAPGLPENPRYTAWVGCEYLPLDPGPGGTQAGLGWLARHGGPALCPPAPSGPLDLAAVRANPRAALRQWFQVAVHRAQPAHSLAAALPPPPKGRTLVLGAGKAAGAMAHALEAAWPRHAGAHAPLSGLVVTRYGHTPPRPPGGVPRIEIVEAAHPVPDEAGVQAAARLLALAQGHGLPGGPLTEDDLVLALFSGGGSALLTLPCDGLTLADLQRINRALLASGQPIQAMNAVRKHLSRIQGGRLALACHPAQVVTLALSDVPGDDPAVIASGPTVADPSTCAQALDVLARCGIALPEPVRQALQNGTLETPKPGDSRLTHRGHPHPVRMLATPRQALEAAAQAIRAAGLQAHVLSDEVEGESREVGRVHAALARSAAAGGMAFEAPCVLLSGGETTVTLRPPSGPSGSLGAPGRGGRAGEFALGLAEGLQRHPRIWGLAADTDGIDGVEGNAGVWVTPDTLQRAEAQGLRLALHIDRHDSHGFFAPLGDLLVTGPTHTNVNDFRAVLVL